MKKILAFVFLLFMSMPSLAQEKYFHELKGMEDSTGTTHLFYRILESKQVVCYWYNDEKGEYEPSTGNRTTNHIYHFDRDNDSDSLFIQNSSGVGNFCGDPQGTRTSDFIFFEAHPDSFIAIETYSCCIDASRTEVTDYKSRSFPRATGNVFYDPSNRNFVFGYNPDPFGWNYNYTSISLPRFDSLWYSDPMDYYEMENEISDSLLIFFSIKGISPYNNTYFGIRRDSLILSGDKGVTFDVIMSPFTSKMLSFASDTSIFYTVVDKFYSEPPLWYHEFSLLRVNYRKSQLSADTVFQNRNGFNYNFVPGESNTLFVSDSLDLLVSHNYGEDFEFILSFDDRITGLYKKPDSDILYVLTTNELFEVNTQTLTSTSLKTLPTTNEPEPSDIPNKVELYQNYPNPFNPVTVISYKLPVNSAVSLKVFDLLGREVTVLVDGRMSAGNHEVTFDASGLSSGMYFYRLEANGAVLTKRLTLIK